MRNDEEYHPACTMHSLHSELMFIGSVENPKDEFLSITETRVPYLRSLTIENMLYRGEGNANIVIALPQEHKVIRFRKSLPMEVPSVDGGEKRVQREVEFTRNVISCFFGPYVQIPEMVRYDAVDIAKLSDFIRSMRPVKRRQKEIIDTYATIFPDYTFLKPRLKSDQAIFRSNSTFCVEIKPKQGYIQKTEQRFSTCPYCLNQYAKLRKKIISVRSNYCPFDLFSGVEERMKVALKELLRTPQNNLKIFKDGCIVFDQESSPSDLDDLLVDWFATEYNEHTPSNVDKLCNLIYTALINPFERQQREFFTSHTFSVSGFQDLTSCTDSNTIMRIERCLNLTGKKCNFDSKQLPKNSVLERIRNMQQLPYISTNYIYNIYSKFTSLLNDDTIYSDLAKVYQVYSTIISSILSNGGEHVNAMQEETETIKTNLFQTLFNDIVARKYDNNFNENKNANFDFILSNNIRETLLNGDLIPQTKFNHNFDLDQSLCDSKSSSNQESNDESYKRQTNNTSITTEHLLALQNYLLVATAKDCSILMTFRELNSENISPTLAENTIKLSEELYFLSSVRVSDLDPKSVHSIERHRQRDVDIFESVISLLEKDVLINND